MIFGEIRDEPWYGKNSGLLEGLTTGPHHFKLTGRYLLSIPGPIAAQMHPRAALNLGDKPERTRCGHDQTKRVRPNDALPFATLILAQTIEGIGVTDFNFHGPAVTILVQD